MGLKIAGMTHLHLLALLGKNKASFYGFESRLPQLVLPLFSKSGSVVWCSSIEE